MKGSMKLSKVLFVLVAMLFGNSVYSQSKKEQIQSLKYKIDSLVQVIQSHKKIVDEKRRQNTRRPFVWITVLRKEES